MRRPPIVVRAAHRAVRELRDVVADASDAFSGRRDPMIPPRRGRLVGDGDYRGIGREFLGHLIELTDLQPDDHVLDIGCGSGRIALTLMDFLGQGGEYAGFDVNRKGVNFATRAIGSRDARFAFQWIDVRNQQYNPRGKAPAAELRFPYKEGRFDRALAISLFTHLRSNEVKNYLNETGRVLRPTGRALMTFFLLPERSSLPTNDGAPSLSFTNRRGDEYYVDGTRVGPGVAYEERAIRSWLSDANLEVIEPIHFGSWSGRQNALSFQDVVVTRRR